MGAPVSCPLITGLKISCFIRIGPIATADKAVSIWTAGAVCSIIKELCRVYLRELPRTAHKEKTMRESYITMREGKPVDHYELTCEQWRDRFLKMDIPALAKRFGLNYDGEDLFILYYGEEYRISCKTGMIFLERDPDRRLAFNTVLSIYNLFYYSKPEAKVAGEFVPFRQVKRAAPFDPAFQRTILKPLAQVFSGKMKELRKACEALHGIPVRQGDVGYVIYAFDCMPLTVLFWDGDEEFQAQANILFDRDITEFLHEETVVCIASDLLRRLTEESGLEGMLPAGVI